MSEQTAETVGGDAGVSDARVLLGARRQAYWAVVGRAFWRPVLVRVSVLWIILILVLTVGVPFLANSAPYTAVIEGKRVWPLLKNLTKVDLIWLIGGAAIVIYAVAHWRFGKLPLEIEQLRARRSSWFFTLLVIFCVLSAGIVVFKTDFLDSRDYASMAQNGKLSSAVFAPLRWGYADTEPLEADMLNNPPSAQHVMGTDQNGRDVLARLLWGSRVVFEIGLVSEVIALAIAVVVGTLMGYFVGKVDLFGMRLLEVFEAIPTFFLLITIVAVFGRQLFLIMVVIGLTSWTGMARFIRAEFLRIRQADYIAAARALGLPLRSILFRHMLPNGLTPVIVTFTFGVAGAIVSESGLSFLGVGVEPPTASWGAMLADAGNPGVLFRWWQALAPGALIFITVFAYNIIGESLRDAVDPRMNKIE